MATADAPRQRHHHALTLAVVLSDGVSANDVLFTVMGNGSSGNAVGIVRVSRQAGREGESFTSPETQRERLNDGARRERLDLIHIFDESESVSGGAPLAKRPGLLAAIQEVEAGRAQVVMVSHFDRLVRSLKVQEEAVTRIEAAGGRVLALDVGDITGASAAQWLSGTLLGAVNEYARRSTKERTADAQRSAIARGVPPYASLPLGLRRGDGKRIVADEETIGLAQDVFEMRAAGASWQTIRRHLADHGVDILHRRVGTMLRSRLYIGEIHFGDYTPNLNAHPPLIDRELWERANATIVTRGRQAKSVRLLARLGVLRCATCGSRLVVGSVRQTYAIYRCPPNQETCTARVTIKAETAEVVVVKAVKEVLADLEGRASAETKAREAETALARAQAELDAAIRTLAIVGDEPAAMERLADLRDVRDDAQEEVDRLSRASVGLTISVADWDRLSLEAQRGLIRANVDRATVAPGRGDDRITVELF